MAFLDQYQDDNEELEKENEELVNIKEKLEKEFKILNIDYKKITQLDKSIKIDFDYLEDFEPTQIKALLNLINTIQRQVIEDSLTIRKIDWIAHRDWAVRSLWILKANLQKLLKEIKKK